MNANRYFVALAVGLLTAPEDSYARACAKASELYELERMQQPGTVSAAVGEDGGERTPLLSWLRQKRAERISCVSVAVHEPVGDDEAHLLAGFAGGLPVIVRIRSRCGSADYLAGTVSGPEVLMTTSDLIALLHRQGAPALYRDCVLGEINEFNRCNGRAEVDPADLERYLSTNEGRDAWEVMGEQIFRELQVAACVAGREFVVPDDMRSLVRPVEPSFGSGRMHVWLEPFDEELVTGEHLLRLVEAQAFAGRIWQCCSDKSALAERVGDDFELDSFPVLRAAAWPRYLGRLSADEAAEVRDEIIELVRLECESAGTEPVIPEELDDIFGPGEEERRQLMFRQRLQHDTGWTLAPSAHPWMLAVLDRVDGDPAPACPRPLEQARREFIEAVERIGQFARQVDSGFARLFQLARCCATQADGRGDADLAAIIAQHPDQFESVQQQVEAMIDVFSTFGWGAERTFGLVAVSLADVFGGMGSWNDQWFDGPDQEVFEEVSAALFRSLNRYFESLVSVDS